MQKTSPNHFPHLDALRAFAIFGVFVEHWLPALCTGFSWGHLGVRCFFVLSGFLITGILLKARATVEGGGSSRGFQFRQFYIRRSLRIFPIYYVTLAVGCWLGMESLQRSVWWQAAYGSNILTALRNEWPGYLSHLWSLSVEEQFYLLWPAVMLLVPRRWLLATVGLTVVAAPLTRWWLASLWGAEHLGVYVLTPCCVDALGAGALLALWHNRGGDLQRMWTGSFMTVGLMGMVACVATLSVKSVTYGWLQPLWECTFCVGVVGVAARGARGWWGRLLGSRFLQFSGKISYGLYLYHLFANYVLGMVCNKLGVAKPVDEMVLVPLFVLMTYGGATLSWFFIEQPLNQLKKFFPHDPPPTSSSTSGRLQVGAVGVAQHG